MYAGLDSAAAAHKRGIAAKPRGVSIAYVLVLLLILPLTVEGPEEPLEVVLGVACGVCGVRLP